MNQHIFKKKYGQNFLNDENILKKIYSSITPNENDLIIEIGPGSGNLTKWLQKYNCQLICFEIDQTLEATLNNFKNDKTTIIFTDFLNVNLNELLKNYQYENLYVIANIPYYITTPIIEKITKENINPKELILMVQKEVASRLTAQPKTKEYGYITVWLSYYYDIKKLFDVNRGCFYPVPNVDSSIISLKSKHSFDANYKFDRLIQNAFKFKRKTLKNNLKGYDLSKIEPVLIKNNYSLNNRAEEIPLNVYIEIADNL